MGISYITFVQTYAIPKPTLDKSSITLSLSLAELLSYNETVYSDKDQLFVFYDKKWYTDRV